MFGGKQLQGHVLKRVKEPNGTKKGKAHRNPMFNTRTYLVEFKDGSVMEYIANIIAENIYSQVDQEGWSLTLLNEISGHQSLPSAITNRVPKKTTRGWKLQVEWKDGSSEWVPLKLLKDTNPVELAEYVVSNKIEEKPAFYWWVHDVLWRRKRIISKLKRKYYRTTHKFKIR